MGRSETSGTGVADTKKSRKTSPEHLAGSICPGLPSVLAELAMMLQAKQNVHVTSDTCSVSACNKAASAYGKN